MPRTRKSIIKQNLAKYDVYIEERDFASQYFRVSNIPEVFQAGRNSFLLGVGKQLRRGSRILTEILDSRGNTIFHTAVTNYTEGESIMISVEIYDDTPPGPCTIIIMGEAEGVPSEWQRKYNVRWSKRVSVEPGKKNNAPIVLLDRPRAFASELMLNEPYTSSYQIQEVPISASISRYQVDSLRNGYLIEFETPLTYERTGGYLTGSLTINVADYIDNQTVDFYLPLTKVKNETQAFSENRLITASFGKTIGNIQLRTGSYVTPFNVNNEQGQDVATITSSVVLKYPVLVREELGTQLSYAQIRVAPVTTISGDIHKLRISARDIVEGQLTSSLNYHTVADAELNPLDLIVSSSRFGLVSAGNFYQATNVSNNWYSDTLLQSNIPGFESSGSARYYSADSSPVDDNPVYIDDSTLIRSIYADVETTGSQISGSAGTYGYFIGYSGSFNLLPTTEYELRFDSYYRKSSGSVILDANTGSIDIYIVGNSVFTNDPLGQHVGSINSSGKETEWFEGKIFNFTPLITDEQTLSLRFVIRNGFWNISNIELKPATDFEFTPDEITVIVPNVEFKNCLVEHKIEFINSDNNSINVFALSQPTFFTGSSVDYGILP